MKSCLKNELNKTQIRAAARHSSGVFGSLRLGRGFGLGFGFGFGTGVPGAGVDGAGVPRSKGVGVGEGAGVDPLEPEFMTATNAAKLGLG